MPDSLSRIPGGNVSFQDSMDFNVVKAVVDKGETNTLACIEPNLLEPKLTEQMQQVVNTLAGSLTKLQWKIEQENDLEIGPVVLLVHKIEHLQYKVKKEDDVGSKVLFHVIDGLLYRKWVYKDQITYLQFVLPISFRKRTIMACHDQFGHLGMDKTLVLLQERFFWLKM